MTEEDLIKIENLARIMIEEREARTKKFKASIQGKLAVDLGEATDYYYPETKIARALIYLRGMQRNYERG